MIQNIDLAKRPFYLNQDQEAWVKCKLESMNERQKVGQLFCLMAGEYSEEELEKLISEYYVGGVLFRPIHTKEELQAKYERLDRIAPIPLLKAANLEEGAAGGYLGGTKFAYQEGIAATGNPDMAEKFAKVTAKEGLEAGINWTFSPVADMDINFRNPITNIRTFGSDFATVRDYTRIFVETIQQYGMAACAKHFPGDGVDYRDQHLHPTYNTLSAQEWYDTYGQIYRNMIEGDLLSIMVGHIVQPAVERDVNPNLTEEELLPGSLSRELVTGILRQRYHFNGVITTDATIMGGYIMAMERKKAIPATIAAGCDMIVFTPDFYVDYQFMLNGLKDGSVTKERLDEAVIRILALKAKVACENPVKRMQGKEFVCSMSDVVKYTNECADEAVTLVKNHRDILPVRPGKYKKVKLINVGKEETVDGNLSDIVSDYLKKEGLKVERYDPYVEELHSSICVKHDVLTMYICCKEAESNVTTVRISWCMKHALDIPRFVNEEDSVFIAFGNPYLLQDVPRIPVFINAYTATKVTVEAALDKVFGKSEFKGISPVDPFCGLLDTHL